MHPKICCSPSTTRTCVVMTKHKDYLLYIIRPQNDHIINIIKLRITLCVIETR